jgi:hypothetical protein
MVVRIVADNSKFDSDIDASERKFKTSSAAIVKSAESIADKFRVLDGEAAVWGKSVDLIQQKQEALKNEITELLKKGVDPLDKSIVDLNQEYFRLGKEAEDLANHQKTLKVSMEDLTKIGKTFSLVFTAPIVAAGGLAVKSFSEAEAATKRLSGAIELAGTFTAGATERLSDFATGLMKTTGVSDELIRNLMAQAIAMGRTEEEAKKLASAAVDIAARGILPLDAAFEALQVTYEGLSPRSKELRAITGDLTEAQLRAGVAVDRVAEAVKGAGAEMRNTTEGSAKNFKNSMDELGESFGAVIAPAFNKLINTIAGLADSFAALDIPTKSAIIAGAGVLAVAGPLLIIIPKIVTAVRAMGTAFETSAGPIGIVVAAVALLVAEIAGIVAASRAFKDEQKLVDGAIAGTLTSAQDYNQALAVMKSRYEDIANKANPMVVGPREAARNKTAAAEQLAALELQIEAVERLMHAQTAKDTKAATDTIAKALADTKAASDKVISDAIAASAADAAVKAKLAGDKTLMDSADEIEKNRKEIQSKILADENELRELIIEGTRNAEDAKAVYYAGVEKTAKEAADYLAGLDKDQRDQEIKNARDVEEARIASEDKIAEAEKAARAKAVSDWHGYGAQIVSIISTILDAINAQNARELAAKIVLLDAETKATLDALDKQTSAKLAALDTELQAALWAKGLASAATEEQYRAEITAALAAGDTEKAAALQKSLDTLLITQQYEEKKAAIEAAAAIVKAALDKETQNKILKLQYDADHAAWVGQGITLLFKSALAIIEAYVTGGVVGAALATAAGLAAGAAYFGGEPKLKQLAKGGIIPATPGGMLVRAGEAGQAEAIIPLDQYLPNRATGGGGGGEGMLVHFVFNMDSRPILDKIFPATRNRTVIIHPNGLATS